ncbi:hypothetical protein NTGM5_310003 [Candidatus Nitrotoga sp. M5]|nr:hypothetical protein NTGM5_310003 [Candidatus Nitrotoga sp. M5]
MITIQRFDHRCPNLERDVLKNGLMESEFFVTGLLVGINLKSNFSGPWTH